MVRHHQIQRLGFGFGLGLNLRPFCRIWLGAQYPFRPHLYGAVQQEAATFVQWPNSLGNNPKSIST